MKKHSNKFLLGETLKQAGLITEAQLEVALHEQPQYYHLKIGEILVLHGWIQKRTVNFFAEQWPHFVQKPSQYHLSYYLQQAFLLNQEQINCILQEQKRLPLRFGAIAVMKGWLDQKTVNYFLGHQKAAMKTYSGFHVQIISPLLEKLLFKQNKSFKVATD